MIPSGLDVKSGHVHLCAESVRVGVCVKLCVAEEGGPKKKLREKRERDTYCFCAPLMPTLL
jgi:hypothetical protein